MSNPRLAIYESASEPVIVVGCDGVIEFANHHAETLLNYESGALNGVGIEALIPESRRKPHADLRRMFGLDPAIRPMGPSREIVGLSLRRCRQPPTLPPLGLERNRA